MNNNKPLLILTVLLFTLAFQILPVCATSVLQSEFDTAAKIGGLQSGGTPLTLSQVIGKVLGIALPFLSIVFLILTLYGGISWMTAGGKKENRKKAKDIIISAAIGLAVTLLAYQITSYVLSNIQITG